MEYVAGISGATLGYITGGTRGAGNMGRAAYHYVKDRNNLPKNKTMAPTPPQSSHKKRKLSWSSDGSAVRMVTRGNSGGSRRSQTQSTRSPSIGTSLLARRRARLNRVQGSGAGAVTVRGRKKTRRYKRSVQVSRKLREKIKKVITGQKIFGMTQEISHAVMRLIGTEDNKQICYDITALNSGGDNPYFSNVKVLDAASVLWNEKVQTEVKAVTDSLNFDPLKLKVKVIDSSVTYNFKNNTQRKVNIRLVECYAQSRQVIGNPFAIWQAALAKQATSTGPNQNTQLITELYTNPGMLPDFRKLFKTRTISLEIPAGAEYKHYVQGPQMELFDMQRCWNGSLFQNYHKKACWVLALVIPDLVTTSLGTVGRYNAGGDDETGYGICWEAIQRFKLEMPEMTGFTGDTGATVTPLSQRQFSYAYKTYGIAQSGVIQSVNDENPVQPVQDP